MIHGDALRSFAVYHSVSFGQHTIPVAFRMAAPSHSTAQQTAIPRLTLPYAAMTLPQPFAHPSPHLGEGQSQHFASHVGLISIPLGREYCRCPPVNGTAHYARIRGHLNLAGLTADRRQCRGQAHRHTHQPSV